MNNKQILALLLGIYLLLLGVGIMFGEFSPDAYFRGLVVGVALGVLNWRKEV